MLFVQIANGIRRFALAGALGCAVTHGALTPVDVVKTRIQLEPEVYNRVGRFFKQFLRILRIVRRGVNVTNNRVWLPLSDKSLPRRVPVLFSPVSAPPPSVTPSRVPSSSVGK